MSAKTALFTAKTARADALHLATQALRQAHIDTPAREARWLMEAALHLAPGTALLAPQAPLDAHAATLCAMLERRLTHEPLSRILGQRDFYGLTLHLNAATLDPRPDSETLVEAVLAALRARAAGLAPLTLLDLGTGSGALLLALLTHLPHATGLGIDIAPEACAQAQTNAQILGLESRARFMPGDFCTPHSLPRQVTPESLPRQAMATTARTGFDVVIANPPYIPSAVVDTLAPEVRLFDPRLALDGGADGLVFYRAIFAGLPLWAKPGALVAVEIGYDQRAAVCALAQAGGIENPQCLADTGACDRVVMGTYSPKSANRTNKLR